MHILPSACGRRKHNKHLVPRYLDQARAHGEGSGAQSDNVPWDSPRAVMHTSGPYSAGCYLRHRSKLQEGADLVRGRRPQQSIPCSVGTACVRQVHDQHAANLPEMKIPGPNGVITVTGDFRKSLECTSAGGSLADSQVIETEKRQLGKVIAMAQAQSKAPLPVGPTKRADGE